jgi:beta-galactosidase
LRWDDVTYEPGEVKVVAYKGGKEWAKSTIKTASAPATLELTPDRPEIRADGRDLSFVTVRIIDEDGSTAPRSNNRVKFTIDGPGEIVATDNGDPTNLESFHLPHREAFNGYCLVIVRAKPTEAGKITLHAESAQLKGASVILQSVRNSK